MDDDQLISDDPQVAIQARLRQRAAQYAAPLTEPDSAADRFTALTFDLGGERYGVDVMLVQAIRTAPHITPVPGSPRFYRGVVNLRGRITTVLDLRVFFDLNADDLQQPDELVVVRANRLEMALLAHHVRGVDDIPKAEIEPMTDMRYTFGVTPERLVLLDIAALFEDERLVIGGVDNAG